MILKMNIREVKAIGIIRDNIDELENEYILIFFVRYALAASQASIHSLYTSIGSERKLIVV